MKIIDGCAACAKMAYKLSDISFIYPITPSSPMASQMDLLSNNNEKNIFDDNVNVIQMQSEGGAAGALHGALISGSLASTFTSSQGLLLMLPNMYKMAGEMLPGVIHVASRSLSTHALSIFGDHQDIYATRMTGFSILASTNVQDAYNLALIAHLSALDSSIPFLHFFDGFRTSHEVNVIEEITNDKIKSLVNIDKINEFRKRALNSGKSITKGTAQNEDIYFQMMEAKNIYYDKIPDIVNENMQKLNNLIKTNYQPFNYYGSPLAKYVIVAMGSVCDTIKEVIANINKIKNEYGLIEVHLYRPFSKKYLEKVLPKSVKYIAVLDRTKEHGSVGEPLYLDVLSTLNNKDINIYGGRYGLSSKNTTPNDIYDIFMMLENNPKHNFTISIDDDVTNTSLKHYDYQSKSKYKEIKIYGFGSDGLVSSSKDILKIIGTDNYIQGYSEYDSKKSGGVTINHLRFSDKLIKAPYYTTNPELIVISKDEYFHKFDMISNINQEGTILINTSRNDEELNKFLPNSVKKIINNKKIKVYTIDAENISLKNNIKGKISIIMEANIFMLLNYPNYEKVLTKSVTERFKEKGKDIVEANINSIKDSKK
ncbi:MAG: 2-oxoacid:acceptor oxidoreductase family protein, partial [Bacilli bacterium]|nr:2-oxoacid:acceptor oxidoreductase family protein [Bacilli bacterium]MDD4408200.1 2-oxoacid:acceptor oxidoreductase family protein [Bacilli bacterium]